MSERTDLRPYFFFLNDPRDSGMSLVFAPDRREAKRIGFREWPGWEREWIDARVRRADDRYRVFAASTAPHCVDAYDGDYETWEDALEATILARVRGDEK
jgi:hypothetical protein